MGNCFSQDNNTAQRLKYAEDAKNKDMQSDWSHSRKMANARAHIGGVQPKHSSNRSKRK